MADSNFAETAWAVVDRVIRGDSTGFSESHTLAIATVPDPAKGDYLVEPSTLMHIEGMVFPDSTLKDWGWTKIGDWIEVETQHVKAYESRIFGLIPPYRGAVQVRRTTVWAPGEEDAPDTEA